MKHHIVRPLMTICRCVRQIASSVLNGRNIFQFAFNFFINFLPVLVWLMIFKNAGLLPNELRPPIHVKFAMTLDEYIFDIFDHPTYAVTFLLLLVTSCGSLIHFGYRINNIPGSNGGSNHINNQLPNEDELELQLFNIPMDSVLVSELLPPVLDDPLPPNFIELSNTESALGQLSNANRSAVRLEDPWPRPLNCWYLAPPILAANSWFILNFVDWAKDPISVSKDILAWFLYVVCHLLAPIFTAIWLYLFQPAGALGLFSTGLGIQNIGGVLTHLIFPNVPPWYIHFYGKDTIPDYDMPGFAAGLIRIDMIMGTHINTAGFHISPIVFGALPSLHSAMAVMIFLFVSHYSRTTILKVASLIYLMLQWWATIYLDHHWRVDLFVGMLYAIASFTFLLFSSRGFAFVERKCIKTRAQSDFTGGSTAGMRLFRNTKLQSFFDPYA
ncbi:Inositolphosphotransferase 1 [Scheffersomyces xylosifermentans]|uniref:Inositolphosphotransferase 1 n=1 Tax=Scheffersomyces xylosifermentans TaxID=1304137 RepID=UPI00315D9EB1